MRNLLLLFTIIPAISLAQDTIVFDFEDEFKKELAVSETAIDYQNNTGSDWWYANVIDDNGTLRAEGLTHIEDGFFGTAKFYDKNGQLQEVRHYAQSDDGRKIKIGLWLYYKKGELSKTERHTYHPNGIVYCEEVAYDTLYFVEQVSTVPKWMTKEDSQKLEKALNGDGVFKHIYVVYHASGGAWWEEIKYTGSKTEDKTPYLGFEGTIFEFEYGKTLFSYQFSYMESHEQTKYAHYEDGFESSIVYYAELDEIRAEWDKVLNE